MDRGDRILFLLVSLAVSSSVGAAEPATIGPLDLEKAVDYALRHHPSLQSQLANEQARRAQVAVGRAGYLPELDLSAQINVGTGNVLRGSLFSMHDLPNVSGPPTGRSWRRSSRRRRRSGMR